MDLSSRSFDDLLEALSDAARQRGLTDSAWARRAGIRKETLSRVRSRRSADFATLHALADAVGARIDVLGATSQTRAGDHFPDTFDRDYEECLLTLAVAGDDDPQRWLQTGPAFFMAGLAVMMASVRGLNRRRLLYLAERLHPGSSQPEVFSLWLARSPVKPARFVPMLKERLRHAA
jgi:DNA-binding phage protein